MEIRKLFKDYSIQLQPIYSNHEAESLVWWLFDHFLGITRMDILQERQVEVPPALEQAMGKLLEGMPVQHITGSAPFYGRDFQVSPSVLIPRNETEELVHLIIKENKSPDLRILDVGTGSGCIPITLALEMDESKITAVDVSDSALALAKFNSEVHGAASSINLILSNVLQEELPVADLDILVSNPPYIRESEKSLMHRNVLEHEPHVALFVPDSDPLVFYRAISKKAKEALKPRGKLYFEINEALGKQVVDLLAALDYTKIRLIKDLNGKDRIVAAVKR